MTQLKEDAAEREAPTIGVLTALPKEHAAMKEMLDHRRRTLRTGTHYIIGEMPSSADGTHQLALGLLDDMGNNQAAVATTNMLRDFPTISEVVFVGIAGAVPDVEHVERHVRLGDVVVSGREGVVQHDIGKAKGGKLQRRPAPRPVSARFMAAVRRLESELLGGSPLSLELHRGGDIQGAEQPSRETDRVRATPPAEGWLNHPVDSYRREGQPRVFSGPILSGNTVVKDAILRDALRDEYEAMAIEMEGSGLADAAHSSSVPYFVVRGMCDYCDEDKNSVWQGYAALIAAAFLRRLLLDVAPLSTESSSTNRLATMTGSLKRCLNANLLMGLLYALMAVLMAGCGLALHDSFPANAGGRWGGAVVGAAAVFAPLFYRGRLEWVLSRVIGSHSLLRQVRAIHQDVLLLIQHIDQFLAGCRRRCHHG